MLCVQGRYVSEMAITRRSGRTIVPLNSIPCMWTQGVWVDAALIVGLPEQLLLQLWPGERVVLLQ